MSLASIDFGAKVDLSLRYVREFRDFDRRPPDICNPFHEENDVFVPHLGEGIEQCFSVQLAGHMFRFASPSNG